MNRKKINIVWTTPEAIITQDPELAGKTIATSRLSFATDGSPVEIINPDQDSPENPAVKKDERKKKGPHGRPSGHGRL